LLQAAAFLLLLVTATAPTAAADAVKGEVSAAVENGFARLVFVLSEDVESQVRVANNIITISFQRPVEINVDRIGMSAGGFISVARHDPDGKAVRLALARKVTVNSMAAGERLFVDLLPDSWVGLPPGLPQNVIEELARRAREGEKQMRQQRQLAQEKQKPIPVRVVVQPTFTRYVFQLPELIGVSADNTKDKLTLTFDKALRFDLADAKAALPPMIQAVDNELDENATVVRFTFSGKVDLRTFREDNSYVVDVSPAKPEAKSERQDDTVRSDELSALTAELIARKDAPPAVEPPQTVPARSVPAVVPADKVAPAAAAKARDSAAARVPDSAGTSINAALKRLGDNLALVFPFTRPTPAAIFLRGETLWLVFDTSATLSIAALEAETGRIFKNASLTRERDTTIVRVKLERPQLVSVAAEGTAWTITLGSEMVEPTRPLAVSRNIVSASRSSITVPIEDPRDLHRLEDPDAGDALLVVTALAPARGFVKTQAFVELRVLASGHGVVVQPLADDVNAELSVDKIIITRPTGLTLSSTAGAGSNAPSHRQMLDTQSWGFDREAAFEERKSELIEAAALAPESKRLSARTDLARFYLARDMAAEAKAVLDVALGDQPITAEETAPLVLRAVANIMLGRIDVALKDLSNPLVGDQHDAPLWRALAYARFGKWADARDGFRKVEGAMGTLPLDMQRTIMKEVIRAFIEVGDITGAVTQMHEFQAVGIPRELEPALAVLDGRIAEGLGRKDDARRSYHRAAESRDRRAAAQGRLREIVLENARGDLKPSDAITDLETLTTVWRGDETEIEGLQLLARLYTDESRYREAFQIMRTALAVHPNSEMTRRIQDEAMGTFDSVFLGDKGDALPAIEALSLFYDFRELIPIGRRGDEMIRRLADRLVSVDLLDQAAALLQYQVEHRLEGAARAQVGTRLAVIYLMSRKPDRALAVLRTTRIAELNNDTRNQRLLLEARALSNLGRHDVALEVVAGLSGQETIRLRSDILWAGKHWREAAEQIEVLYGDRWQAAEPLGESQRTDILRAAIGYALGEDAIGLQRIRERYAGKLGDGADRRAFEVVTAPIETSGAEFRAIAHSIAAMDTLNSFLRDLRARYPEAAAPPPVQPRIPAAPPQSNVPAPDPESTGTLPSPRRLPVGRTAQVR
jgi:tetratricopeptide (TPR) repeat protein